MSEIVDANDLDNLKRQLSYTFLDAYGNFDGADILFDCIVKATEDRIIKLLEFPNGWHETVYVAGEGDEHFASSCVTCLNIALIKGEQK